jgi:amino acid transporter
MGGAMILHTSPYRLVVLPGIIVLIWLLALVGVLPADVVASVSTIVVLCALAPVGRWFGQSQDRDGADEVAGLTR